MWLSECDRIFIANYGSTKRSLLAWRLGVRVVGIGFIGFVMADHAAGRSAQFSVTGHVPATPPTMAPLMHYDPIEVGSDPAVREDLGLRDDGAERGHARRKPGRHASTVQRKNCAAGSSCHRI